MSPSGGDLFNLWKWSWSYVNKPSAGWRRPSKRNREAIFVRGPGWNRRTLLVMWYLHFTQRLEKTISVNLATWGINFGWLWVILQKWCRTQQMEYYCFRVHYLLRIFIQFYIQKKDTQRSKIKSMNYLTIVLNNNMKGGAAQGKYSLAFEPGHSWTPWLISYA